MIIIRAPRKNLLKMPFLPAIILIFVIITGTIGYKVLWYDYNPSIIESFFMTIITITTIGFNETYYLDDTGKIFTIIIAIAGIGSLFYILSVIMENLFIMQLLNLRGEKKMIKKIEKMSGHIILIGLGRVGMLAAKELMKQGKEFLAIDDKINDKSETHNSENMIVIEGDATQDHILLKAGIQKAKGLIVTTGNSSTSVFVVLSARVLNPELYIIARTDYDEHVEKLMRAGANRVINPYAIGGKHLADLMVNPNVIDFFETSFSSGEYNLSIDKIRLPENCDWIGKTMKEINLRQISGTTILAIIRNDKPILNPDSNFAFKEGDQLVSFGTKEELITLEKIINGYNN